MICLVFIYYIKRNVHAAAPAANEMKPNILIGVIAFLNGSNATIGRTTKKERMKAVMNSAIGLHQVPAKNGATIANAKTPMLAMDFIQ